MQYFFIFNSICAACDSFQLVWWVMFYCSTSLQKRNTNFKSGCFAEIKQISHLFSSGKEKKESEYYFGTFVLDSVQGCNSIMCRGVLSVRLCRQDLHNFPLVLPIHLLSLHPPITSLRSKLYHDPIEWTMCAGTVNFIPNRAFLFLSFFSNACLL